MPDLQPHSPAMGQKDGGKWAAAADLQPTTSKSDRLLGQAGRCDRDAPIHGLEAHDPAIMSERYVAAVPYQQIDLKNRSSNQKISGFCPRSAPGWQSCCTQLVRGVAGRRLSPVASRNHGRRLYLMEQPQSGLTQQRGVAAGLPAEQSLARTTRALPASTKSSAFSTTRRSPLITNWPSSAVFHAEWHK